jgi:hypothetical protein
LVGTRPWERTPVGPCGGRGEGDGRTEVGASGGLPVEVCTICCVGRGERRRRPDPEGGESTQPITEGEDWCWTLASPVPGRATLRVLSWFRSRSVSRRGVELSVGRVSTAPHFVSGTALGREVWRAGAGRVPAGSRPNGKPGSGLVPAGSRPDGKPPPCRRRGGRRRGGRRGHGRMASPARGVYRRGHGRMASPPCRSRGGRRRGGRRREQPDHHVTVDPLSTVLLAGGFWPMTFPF